MTEAVLTTEMQRVLGLPQRTATTWEPPRQPVQPAEPLQLRPVQAEALGEIHAVGAGLISAGVGHGKTLIGILAGAALGVDRTVYLCPPACVEQVEATVQRAAENWVFPPVFVVPWSRLSMQVGDDWLEAAAGNGTFALVCDEAHVLRSATTGRTQRLLRFRKANVQRSRVVLMSGTLTRRNLLDLVDVAWVALGKRSPVPTGSTGAALASYIEDPQWGRGAGEAAALRKWAGCTDVVEALGKRIRSAPGVVTTVSQSVEIPIYVVPMVGARAPSTVVKELLKKTEEVAATFRVPDGDDLVSPADVARVSRQLALGYHLIWTWRGDPDREWIEARRAWSALARQACMSGQFLTEGDFYQHCSLGFFESAKAEAVWREWAACKADPDRAPVPKPVWHTHHIVRGLVDSAKQQRNCLIWYDETAVVPLLREWGVQCPEPGEVPCTRISAVSVRAHGTGLDLQSWSRNVMMTVPSASAVWEQILGRTHRPGQTADEVVVWRPAWAPSFNAAWSAAKKSATYVRLVTGQPQKLELVQEVSDVSEF